MSKVEYVKDFNSILDTFLGQLSPLIGSFYQNKCRQLTKLNSTIGIKKFYEYVVPHKKQIMEEDETYFKNDLDYNKINKFNKNTSDFFLEEIVRLKNIYDKLDLENRKQMWSYFQALLILSEQYHN